MRVSDNSYMLSLQKYMQQSQSDLFKYTMQISTGLKTENPSDDPSAMGRILKIQAEQGNVSQYSSNIQRANNITQVSYSNMNKLKEFSVRNQELMIQAGNPTNIEGMKNYATEADQILEQSLAVANTQYLGEYIFSGAKTDQQPFTAIRDANGKITSISYNGSASGSAEIKFDISKSIQISPFTNPEENGKILTNLQKMLEVRQAMELDPADPSAVSALSTDMINAGNGIIANIGSISSKMGTLQSCETQNSDRSQSLTEQISQDTDADLAQAIMKLSKTQMVYNANLSVISKILNNTVLNYL